MTLQLGMKVVLKKKNTIMRLLFFLMLLSSVTIAQVKQPKCRTTKGFVISHHKYHKKSLYRNLPQNYTGVSKKCIRNKVVWLYNFKNGQQHGLCREWYSTGQLKLEGSFLNGKKNGVYKRWYPDGKIECEVNYINGERHSFESWHESGKLHHKKVYKKDKLIIEKCVDKFGKEYNCGICGCFPCSGPKVRHDRVPHNK